VSNKHRLVRENRELMEENDRLIGKIEKLVDIFGSNLDTEIMRYSSSIDRTASNSSPSNPIAPASATEPAPTERPKSPPSVLLTNTRLYLLSQRAKRDQTMESGTPPTRHAFSPRDDMDMGRKQKIDRSMGALVETSPDPPRAEPPKKSGFFGNKNPAPKAAPKSNQQLKHELNQLDHALNQEIKSAAAPKKK
jgi:hypothetical protein